MDGEEMRSKKISKKAGGIINVKIPAHSNIDLLSQNDRRTALLFILLFIISIAAYWYLINYQDMSVYTALPVMAVPLFVIGVIYYIIRRRFIAMIFILVV